MNNGPIICAVEEWDSIINYYRPNGTSKTWYINELNELNIPLTWGAWNMLNMETGKMFDSYEHVSCINFGQEVEYHPKEKLNRDKYFYIIPIFDPGFFTKNKEIGFSCIDKLFLSDIRYGNCKLILILSFEGYSGAKNNYDLEIIDNWCEKEQIPYKNVYYLNGNLISNIVALKKNIKINVIPVHIFDSWISIRNVGLNKIVEYNPIDKKYLYLSYNRASRDHRIALGAKLYEKGLLDDGLVSFGDLKQRERVQHIANKLELNETMLTKFIQKTPITIDRDLRINLATVLSKNDHIKTFISLVTETLIDEDTLFLSEKIWKPISFGHPFMLIGNKHSLKYLKEMGYKTFDKWIDEGYDDFDNYIDRINHIVSELLRFKRMDIQTLVSVREEMKEVCEYNKKTFTAQLLKKYPHNVEYFLSGACAQQPILDILIKIWEGKSIWNKTFFWKKKLI
jgi:hypothetical protein